MQAKMNQLSTQPGQHRGEASTARIVGNIAGGLIYFMPQGSLEMWQLMALDRQFNPTLVILFVQKSDYYTV